MAGHYWRKVLHTGRAPCYQWASLVRSVTAVKLEWSIHEKLNSDLLKSPLNMSTPDAHMFVSFYHRVETLRHFGHHDNDELHMRMGEFKGSVVCESPNERLERFEGNLEWNGERISLDNSNVVLRG